MEAVGLGVMGLGGTEVLILIMAALLLFFGGKKLPELAKGLGRAMGEFQRGRREIDKELGRTGRNDAATAGPRGDGAPARRVRRLKAGEPGPPGGAGRESNLVLAARALGIETEGKSDEELKKEIANFANN